MTRDRNIEHLVTKLGYQFKDLDLLKRALSHRSFGPDNNERLEFLGDSIVNFVIAEALYEKFPQAQEGQLSRLRASLVNGDSLTLLAKEFDLSQHLRLGAGEMKSGGAKRHSILADTVEAIVAAIYIDSNLPTCKQCILRWYHNRLVDLTITDVVKDPKTQLQEYLQANKLPLPEYEISDIAGKDHEQVFTVICRVPETDYEAIAQGRSRRKAEQTAANLMLELLVDD